ncbi:MAG TPA: TetR/AcrR family transcriptional regulator [Myxococcales bacterium]
MEQAKKDCILLEAARAFSRFGFKKTSVDEIARAAGVAKGTIYLAVESKEDLFYQALHREVREWVAEVSKLIDPRKAADELLGEMALFGFQKLEESPLVRDLLSGKTRELLPMWSNQFDELRGLGRQNVVEVLRLGIRQGRFRPELDVENVATVLQDMQIAGYFFHGMRGLNETLAQQLAAGLDMVLNGLRVRA